MSSRSSKAANRRVRLLRSPWTQALLVLFLLALVQGLFVKVYQVPSGSMEQTLNVGDRVLLNRTAYVFSAPERGDVVVFRKPGRWGPAPERTFLRTAVGWLSEVSGIGPGNTEYLVKRIVGRPGDTVECCEISGGIAVNGTPIKEPYVYRDVPFESGTSDCSTPVKSPRCFGPIHLGGDQYLVMGDNRSNSEDSVSACRMASASVDCVKTASRQDLVGRVDWFLFPFNKWGQGESLNGP